MHIHIYIRSDLDGLVRDKNYIRTRTEMYPVDSNTMHYYVACYVYQSLMRGSNTCRAQSHCTRATATEPFSKNRGRGSEIAVRIAGLNSSPNGPHRLVASSAECGGRR
ncbi:unnamed protein product [Calicophoron daubneyi]|uniref:Uncharacterized protein n=1 Tax=Calicophoron daubneyi TaxID=300641 RepID=A0AAV2TDA4_CALDB